MMISPATVILPAMSLISYVGFSLNKYLHLIFIGVVIFMLVQIGKTIFH